MIGHAVVALIMIIMHIQSVFQTVGVSKKKIPNSKISTMFDQTINFNTNVHLYYVLVLLWGALLPRLDRHQVCAISLGGLLITFRHGHPAHGHIDLVTALVHYGPRRHVLARRVVIRVCQPPDNTFYWYFCRCYLLFARGRFELSRNSKSVDFWTKKYR